MEMTLLADQLSRRTYREAGLDASRPASPNVICHRLFGTYPQRVCMLARGSVVRVNGSVRIFVNRNLRPPMARFVAFHEVAHELWNFDEPSTREDFCNRLAASLTAPTPAVMYATTKIGSHYRSLAQAFKCAESMMVLRLAECFGVPAYLSTELRQVSRGLPYDWSVVRSATTEREIAKRGIVRVPILDERRHTAYTFKLPL